MDFELPKTFRFAGVTSGIKESGKRDLAIIVSNEPCVAAGVYTQNVVRAPSISWNEKITPGSNIRAVVINSGNANACTGEQGTQDNESMARETAKVLGESVQPKDVLVLSTGIIGVHLPMENVLRGIGAAAKELGNSRSHFQDASEAILTSDKSTKTLHQNFEINGQNYRLSAMAKGAGMIGPRMATMLCAITTDFPIAASAADMVLRTAVDASFNRISVEGHTSTNDAVIFLAPPAEKAVVASEFQQVLTAFCIQLAKLIPSDGEGASHLIEIRIQGAADDKQSDRIARAVAASNLVKTAVTGNDPNWGRIVSAIGSIEIEIDPQQVGLAINGKAVFQNGQPIEFSEVDLSDSMAEQFEVLFELVVGNGTGEAVHWTSDLTTDYVRFNSEYTT